MDITRIQEKNNLAKDLVQQGLAQNIDEALAQIDLKKMVKSEDDFLNDSPKQSDDMVSEGIKDGGLNNKVEKVREQVDRLAGFITKYQESTDANLMELERQLKEINAKLGTMKQPAAEAVPAENTGEGDIQEQEDGELNPDDFAVEKIFNNSNGRLEKR